MSQKALSPESTFRSETMSVSEGLLEPAFWTLRFKKDSRSESSAPCVWVISAGNALGPGSTSRVEGGILGRSSE